jgi:hypothetical protein
MDHFKGINFPSADPKLARGIDDVRSARACTLDANDLDTVLKLGGLTQLGRNRILYCS